MLWFQAVPKRLESERRTWLRLHSFVMTPSLPKAWDGMRLRDRQGIVLRSAKLRPAYPTNTTRCH